MTGIAAKPLVAIEGEDDSVTPPRQADVVKVHPSPEAERVERGEFGERDGMHLRIWRIGLGSICPRLDQACETLIDQC